MILKMNTKRSEVVLFLKQLGKFTFLADEIMARCKRGIVHSQAKRVLVGAEVVRGTLRVTYTFQYEAAADQEDVYLYRLCKGGWSYRRRVINPRASGLWRLPVKEARRSMRESNLPYYIYINF